MKGILKNIPKGKMFGFITGEDGIEYFLHRGAFNGFWEDLENDLEKGLKVELEFEAKSGAKGPRAEVVHRVDYPNQTTV